MYINESLYETYRDKLYPKSLYPDNEKYELRILEVANFIGHNPLYPDVALVETKYNGDIMRYDVIECYTPNSGLYVTTLEWLADALRIFHDFAGLNDLLEQASEEKDKNQLK